VICLLPHCAALSEVSRMLEIHRALRSRGAPVRVATQGGSYETVLRSAGVPYDVIGPRMSEQRCAEFMRNAVGVGNVRQSMYTDAELRSYVRAEAAYFRTNHVQVAVTGFTLTALLSTRLAGIPLVTEHAGCWVPPTYERGLLPAPIEPIKPALRALPRPVMQWLTNASPRWLRFYCGGFNRVAAELGVPGVPSLAALMLGDLTLVPEVPEILGIPAAELAGWRPAGRAAYWPTTRLRYTGPLYARLDVPLPDRVVDFLNRPGRVIYVAITSSSADLVRGVVRQLSSLDERILVAGTLHDLGDLASDRVLVAGVLPSHLVMPRVDLAVTAGGQGSVQTAMAAGTPLVGIPLQPEQDLNVALLERQGAARRISTRQASTPSLAQLARQMLTDERYRESAARVQRYYDGVDGPGNAADAIIALAAAQPMASRPATHRREAVS